MKKTMFVTMIAMLMLATSAMGAVNVVSSNGIQLNPLAHPILPPTITADPVGGNVYETDTTPVSLNVGATGLGKVYHWVGPNGPVVDGANTNGTVFAGATTDTLTITAAANDSSYKDSGVYYVIVSNGVAPDATSGSATVNIYTQPVVSEIGSPIAAILGNLDVLIGDSESITAVITPAGANPHAPASATFLWTKDGATVTFDSHVTVSNAFYTGDTVNFVEPGVGVQLIDSGNYLATAACTP